MADKKSPFAALRGSKKAEKPKEETGLGKTRRRLSVVSDNKLVEGLSGLATEDAVAAADQSQGGHVVKAYAGVSKKGSSNHATSNTSVVVSGHWKSASVTS